MAEAKAGRQPKAIGWKGNHRGSQGQQAGAAARGRRYLDKAILCEGHKSDGHSGDEDSSDGDEATDEDEQS